MAAHRSEAYDEGLAPLNEALGAVRFLESEAEVREWTRFDDDVYGPGVITYDLLLGWWTSYKKGAIGLFNDSRIDAILAIWPLRKLALQHIVRGLKQEKEIRPTDVLSESHSRKCRTWYLSGFAVRANLRSTKGVITFLRVAIETWQSDTPLQFPLDLCAFGYSTRGENFLRRFGFSLQTPASGEEAWPVYLLHIPNRRWLQQRLSRIKLEQRNAKTKKQDAFDLERFSELIQNTVPDCDPIITTYFRESIAAFKVGLLRCSAFLLGAASETAITLLINSYATAIIDKQHSQRFLERTNNKVISKKFQEFMQSYKSCKTHPSDPKLLSDSMSMTYLFDRYRTTRNEVGHPAVLAEIDREDLLADMANFTRYLKTIYALINFFKSHPVTV